MKKFKLVIVATISLFVLGACGSSEDLTDYAFASFSGLDSQGEAEYGIDVDSLFSELFPKGGTKAQEEILNIESAFEITLDNEEELSNGDKVIATIIVDKDKTKSVVGGEKEFTVEGLEEPIEVTTEEIEKGLVVNFIGASGQGEAQMDSTLPSPLSGIDFTIEDDGELKNDDKAKIILSEDAEHYLNQEGYILEKEFNPIVVVKGLDIIAEKAEDIKNLKDIERMIDEEVNRRYEDTEYPARNYKTKQEKLMYRQFEEQDSNNSFGTNAESGTLVGIYSVEMYIADEDTKNPEEEFTVIIGFSNIILDEDNKTNVSKLEEFREEKDNTYSLDSVFQLYEGNGFTEVKKSNKKED